MPITILPADGPEANKVVWTGTGANSANAQVRQLDDKGNVVHQAKQSTFPEMDVAFRTTLMNDYYSKVGSSLVPAKVSTGYGHTLALRADNTIWAYGINDHGQLGVGLTNGQLHMNGPIEGWDDPQEIQTYVWKGNRYVSDVLYQLSDDGVTIRQRPRKLIIQASPPYPPRPGRNFQEYDLPASGPHRGSPVSRLRILISCS